MKFTSIIVLAVSILVLLFNLKNDPGETNNLVEKKSQKAQNTAAKVLAWRRSMPVEIPQ
jgi:hypothetical protein